MGQALFGSRSSRLLSLLVCSGAALSSACSANKQNTVNFAFDRPEYVETVCIDVITSNGLPMACCSPTRDNEPLAPEAPPPGQPSFLAPAEDTPLGRACIGADPQLHALVTQSVRGEVAAVDLVTRRVIDSDQRIPGYTFVDVGGFPTAVVAPLERPTPGSDPDVVEGPPWTYVSSGADNAVRAVATCHYRTGVPCGPERPDPSGPIIDSSKVEFFLPDTPFDMLMGPDEALWVSLPASGVLARIEVATRPSVDADGGAATDDGVEPEQDLPFVMDPLDPNKLANPKYFEVPAPNSYDLPDAQVDSPLYTDLCGQGYAVVPSAPVLPSAPRLIPEESTVAPSRMRYDAVSGLLFVSDQKLPVLHVFSLNTEGALVTRGSVAVGAPLKDFTLTPYVPANSPALFADPSIQPPNPESISDREGPQKRYLYGLDSAGGLLAFELTTTATGASVIPLLAPVPSDRFQDRMQMATRFSVGAALDVVDTRPTSPENCGTGENGVPVVPMGTTSIVTQLQSQLDTAKANLTAAEQNGGDVAAATIARNKAQRRFEIARDAGPFQLRGVFLIVISMAGELTVFDILDLDVQCRAETSCNNPNTQQLLEGSGQVQNGTTPIALAVQRNAPRLVLGQEPTVQVTATTAFEGAMCSTPQYVPASEPLDTADQRLICLIADPWAERDQNWTVQTDSAIPGLRLPGAVLDSSLDGNPLPADQLVLRAPAGVSLCGRGAQGNVDDQVVVLGGSNTELSNDCPQAAAGSEPRLKIIEAHDQFLVLRALGVSEGNTDVEAELTSASVALDANELEPARRRAEAEVARLLRCFPEFVGFEVRTGNSLVTSACPAEGACTLANLSVEPTYLVTGTVTEYLHRVIPGPDGVCIEDLAKDERYTSRAKQGVPFENLLLGFTLSEDAASVVSLATSQGSTQLRETIVSTDPTAARPTSIRYFPFTNELFVVDSATQGLRRLLLSPFQVDEDSSYR